MPSALACSAAIAGDARPEDIDELWAYARATPADCMWLGLRDSIRAWTAVWGDVPVAMFGLAPVSLLRGIGTPWMVGSNALRRPSLQRDLLRLSRPCVDEMQTLTPFLFNVVHEANAPAKRWLRWLGFELGQVTHQGPDAAAFRYFSKGQFHG